MKLLIIEDDMVLLDELFKRFNEWDIDAFGIKDFSDVMNDFIEVKPNLVIIDITLPKYDGFYWCRMIRNISSVPIIFLSSRDHPADMVMSMQMGADDYVQKPFNFEVLNAKVQALLRRTYEYKATDVSVYKYRNAVFDFKKLKIIMEENEVELTKNESYILSILAQNIDEVISRNDIIESLWDDSRFISDNTLTVNVNRLRKKLEEIGLDDAIETKTGSGYVLKG
ncbi:MULTISPECIES: response regulator transcription factor [Jeotgalicoccus]|uniref:response regulator transcription factor n=1 Tax=Jeotgalicoccus TaxID=227979 RepID=UPI0003FCA683|nr:MULTISPECIES: response regulator transcription factor [Jeotgalicoccus]QQD85213.1 response regulator transcription factor [Jeotgalicoccus sp. ATCC 8456]